MTNTIAYLIVAAIPWAVAQPTLRWHPALQTAPARRTFRLFTAGLALAVTAATIVPNALASLAWLGLIIGGLVLDGLWFRRSRTAKGRAVLAYAKNPTSG